MTSLGGRAAKVTRAASPQRVFERIPVAQVGEGCVCGVGPVSYAGNPLNGRGATVTTCDIVTDMRAEMTFVSFDTSNYNEWALVTRLDASGHHYYFYWVPSSGVSPYTTYYISIREGHPGFGDNVIDESFPGTVAAPSPGDVLELISTGDSHVAKINGSTVLSGAGVNPYTGNGNVGVRQIYSPAPDEWVADMVTEDDCP